LFSHHFFPTPHLIIPSLIFKPFVSGKTLSSNSSQREKQIHFKQLDTVFAHNAKSREPVGYSPTTEAARETFVFGAMNTNLCAAVIDKFILVQAWLGCYFHHFSASPIQIASAQLPEPVLHNGSPPRQLLHGRSALSSAKSPNQIPGASHISRNYGECVHREKKDDPFAGAGN